MHSNSVCYTFVCIIHPAVNYTFNCIIPISFLDLPFLFHVLKKTFINVFRYLPKNLKLVLLASLSKSNHYILTFELGGSFELKAELHCRKFSLY